MASILELLAAHLQLPGSRHAGLHVPTELRALADEEAKQDSGTIESHKSSRSVGLSLCVLVRAAAEAAAATGAARARARLTGRNHT